MLQKTIRNARSGMLIPAFLLLTSMLYVRCSKDIIPTKSLDISETNGPDENGIYKIAEKMPEFEGDLMAYLGSNIKYPKDAQDRKVEGRVMVKFIVNEEGKVAKAHVLRSPDESLTNAALGVVNNMPKWKPAEHKGKKVSVYYHLPVVYKLKGSEADAAAE